MDELQSTTSLASHSSSSTFFGSTKNGLHPEKTNARVRNTRAAIGIVFGICFMMTATFSHAVLAGDIWSYFQIYHVISCYSPDELCDRYDRDFDPTGVGTFPGCLSREPNPNGFQIYEGNDTCPSGSTNLNADIGGCWYSNTPVMCDLPPSANPNLGAAGCAGTNPLVGNPINAASGNKYEKETDLATAEFSVLRFERHYNSQAVNNASSTVGGNWQHNYSSRLTTLYEDNNFENVLIHRPDGSTHYFFYSGGSYASNTSTGQLYSDAQNWRLLSADGIEEHFNSSGKLQSIDYPNGESVQLTYDANGVLLEAQDNLGRRLVFENDGISKITAFSDPNGARWQYSYDASERISEVLLPDETPGDNTDNPSRTYLYEDSRFPSHLTGIIDERGNRIATWTYDGQGRAIASEHADGTDNHSLVYNVDGTTTVTDPQGHARTYSFTTQHGLTKVASITGGDCNHCGGDAASYSYDTNGFVSSKTDFNGNVTTYTRDARGRELSRTEAAGTADARTITTTWHNDFNKPLTVSEPGRLTTYSYDPDGRLLTKTEQPQS